MCTSRSIATTCSKARRWHSASRWRRNTSFENADVILSLDADFLYAGFPGSTRYARDFAKRRNPDAGAMNRLYVVESTPSSTGAKADHRLPLRAADIERLSTVAGIDAWRRSPQALVRRTREQILRGNRDGPDRAIAAPAWSSRETISLPLCTPSPTPQTGTRAMSVRRFSTPTRSMPIPSIRPSR